MAYTLKLAPAAVRQLAGYYVGAPVADRAGIRAVIDEITASLALNPHSNTIPCAQPGFRVVKRWLGRAGNPSSLAVYFDLDDANREVRIVQIELITPHAPI